MHFFDEDTRQFCGPAGSEEEAYASIEKLDDNAYYIAYASLEKLTGYADFYNWAKNREMDAQLWCAVYTSDEDGYMCDSVPVGMLINPSGRLHRLWTGRLIHISASLIIVRIQTAGIYQRIQRKWRRILSVF